MYEKFEDLLKKFNVTTYRVAKDTGIGQSTFTDWKQGKSSPKPDKLKKIADYFNVPLTYFLEEGNEPPQNEATDINQELEAILANIKNNCGLMFDGEALDEKTKELLKDSLEFALNNAKKLAKDKYTPKKKK